MFTTDLALRAVPGGNLFRLAAPLIWADGEQTIEVPPGFLTDLASVPRIAQPLVPVTGPYMSAAVLHDYLFVVQTCAFSEANGLFGAAMASCGVRTTQRWAILAAVTLGGWPAWRRNARDLKADRAGFLASYGLPDSPA